jgi:hypothetical protein
VLLLIIIDDIAHLFNKLLFCAKKEKGTHPKVGAIKVWWFNTMLPSYRFEACGKEVIIMKTQKEAFNPQLSAAPI